MSIGPAGLALIKRFEGFEPGPYRDAVGIPTIGYGATYYPGGQRVRMTDPPITEPEASRLLEQMLERYADAIDRYVQVPITPSMRDALISWAYNVGLEAARTSTLMRLVNAGDFAGAAGQFARWNRAGGQVLAGLTRRRAAERALFSSDMEVQA